MRDGRGIRRYELLFVVSVTVLYVVRRLLEEVDRIDGMVGSAADNGVAAATFWRHLGSYDHTLHTNVPLIAGAFLLLGAWYVFHHLAAPALQRQPDDPGAWLYAVVAGVLILAAVFIYQYMRLYVRYQHDESGRVIGLAVYSLYRKRLVLADAIGVGIVLTAYEAAFGYYTFLARRIAGESEGHFRIVSFLLLMGVSVLATSFALTGSLPPVLWRAGLRDGLLMLGLVLAILFLQAYIYRYVLPALKTPQSSGLFVHIAAVLLLAAAATTILWGASTNFYYYAPDTIVSFTAVVVVGAVTSAYLRRVLTRENQLLQTQVSAKSAELASLRAQINPHFLFNALNSLYATALKENSEKTADGIQKLGDMMRFMLQENNRDRIPLNKEVEYLRNYIELQRMRIDPTHDIDIRVTIQEPVRAIYLAPMMLIPFVENAFKHGISLRQSSWIYITLTLDDTRLYFKVHNSRPVRSTDPASADRHDPEEDRSGVGLDNVRKRLDLIYPGRHQLDIQQSDQDYFVSLTLVYW
ncbi:sensor histidine kinase [Spirosoma sordidisoli]|uniref:Sensor protein lytS n=1 Tax=Spirosoma sordidisoli TaxID=2502893 RepID=A0A4V1RW30_9BACT|nr:histidine kinase [Spirosoma sordidisoli]RYC68838.1 sensor protein lytS [Spirosoma sordidisoli]